MFQILDIVNHRKDYRHNTPVEKVDNWAWIGESRYYVQPLKILGISRYYSVLYIYVQWILSIYVLNIFRLWKCPCDQLWSAAASCCQHEYYIYNGHEISSKSVDMLHEILRVLPHCHWRPCLILDANDSRLLWRRHVGRKVGWSRNTCGSFLLQHCPVECVVILVVQSAEQDPEARIRDCKNLKWEPEKLAQVHVVRRLLKAQAAAVVEIHCKLCWESLAQHLQARFKRWNKIYIHLYAHRQPQLNQAWPTNHPQPVYLNWCGHLFFTDLLVFLLLGCCFQPLPWKRTPVNM